jgi:DNA-3-methyladenine glycosylase II
VSRIYRIKPAAPYSLERTVRPFARFPEERVDLVHGDVYRRAFLIDGEPVLVEASQRSAGELDSPVDIHLLTGAATDALDEIRRSLRWMLAIDEPIAALYDVMAGHPRLDYLATELKGLRRTRKTSPFEGLVFSILAQLISIRGAAVVRGRFVEVYGTALDYEGMRYWTFPEPTALTSATVDELCQLGMTGAKARAILAVADLARAGELELSQLLDESDDAVIRHLTAVPGIGRWTAEWFLVNVLGRMRIVPAGDLGIRRVTGKWLLDEEMPSANDVRRAYDAYGEYAGYVAYYVLSAERHQVEYPATL